MLRQDRECVEGECPSLVEHNISMYRRHIFITSINNTESKGRRKEKRSVEELKVELLEKEIKFRDEKLEIEREKLEMK